MAVLTAIGLGFYSRADDDYLLFKSFLAESWNVNFLGAFLQIGFELSWNHSTVAHNPTVNFTVFSGRVVCGWNVITKSFVDQNQTYSFICEFCLPFFIFNLYYWLTFCSSVAVQKCFAAKCLTFSLWNILLFHSGILTKRFQFGNRT